MINFLTLARKLNFLTGREKKILIFSFPTSGIIILNDSDQVCNNVFTSLFPAFLRSDFMSVQITYGTMALIVLSYFHAHKKKEIFADYWDK
jgi:hypothetical protein